MSDNKNDYMSIKERIFQLEEEIKRMRIDNAEKDGIIARQAERISELVIQGEAAERTVWEERDRHNLIEQKMLEHMDMFRRMLWDSKHTDEERKMH